ncbi:TetR/AcrR family transcriptional regulator [Nocardioides ferulae]|uniref:TetR/AcrR family transcriptional regulator n=1 Tax=Nocardioides ferulae TaxID=2340821 RepID=UPI00198155CD|nr:TetR/AcrR family transcriptional regulator [Nocardioides ferulae]
MTEPLSLLPAAAPTRALPMVDSVPIERRDAARNRRVLLEAAQRLIASCGVDALTMDNLAAEAGVGKGTVFRRFESREGLFAALLDHEETEWQTQVISGPPPLGPGADAEERLLAFGRSRIETVLQLTPLIRNAGRAASKAYAARSFLVMHVRYLLAELGVTGDLPLLATALLAPLEAPIVEHQVEVEGMSVERIHTAWSDLVRRVVAAG